MDLTPTIAPAIADAMTQLKTMIPEDLTQAHDLIDDILLTLSKDESAIVSQLTAAGQTLLGAPDLLSVGRALQAALIIGKQLELYAPAGPFVIRLGDAPK